MTSYQMFGVLWEEYEFYEEAANFHKFPGLQLYSNLKVTAVAPPSAKLWKMIISRTNIFETFLQRLKRIHFGRKQLSRPHQTTEALKYAKFILLEW